jgi:hypothetical protein
MVINFRFRNKLVRTPTLIIIKKNCWKAWRKKEKEKEKVNKKKSHINKNISSRSRLIIAYTPEYNNWA